MLFLRPHGPSNQNAGKNAVSGGDRSLLLRSVTAVVPIMGPPVFKPKQPYGLGQKESRRFLPNSEPELTISRRGRVLSFYVASHHEKDV